MKTLDFPIFLVDTDQYMYIQRTEEELRGLEAIDVEHKEYSGWDRTGVPIAIAMKNGAVVATPTSTAPAFQELVDAIVRYAKLGDQSVSPPENTNLNDPEALFLWADGVVSRNQITLFSTFSKLFKRK